MAVLAPSTALAGPAGEDDTLGACGWYRESWEFPLTQRDKYIRLALILEREAALLEASCLQQRQQRLQLDREVASLQAELWEQGKQAPRPRPAPQTLPRRPPGPPELGEAQGAGALRGPLRRRGEDAPPSPPVAPSPLRRVAAVQPSPARRPSRPSRPPAAGEPARTPLKAAQDTVCMPRFSPESCWSSLGEPEGSPCEWVDALEALPGDADATSPATTTSPAFEPSGEVPPQLRRQVGRDRWQEGAVGEAEEKLLHCGQEDFAELCGGLAQRVEELSPQEAGPLAELLLRLLPRPAAPREADARYWPLIGLLELLCSSRSCVEAMSHRLVRELLEELLWNVAYCSQMRRLDAWTQLLRVADGACAALLAAAGPARGAALAEELGLRPRDLVADTPLLAQRLRGLTPRACAGGPLDDRLGENPEN